MSLLQQTTLGVTCWHFRRVLLCCLATTSSRWRLLTVSATSRLRWMFLCSIQSLFTTWLPSPWPWDNLLSLNWSSPVTLTSHWPWTTAMAVWLRVRRLFHIPILTSGHSTILSTVALLLVTYLNCDTSTPRPATTQCCCQFPIECRVWGTCCRQVSPTIISMWRWHRAVSRWLRQTHW